MPTSLTPTRPQVSAWSGYLDRRTQAGSATGRSKVIIYKLRGETYLRFWLILGWLTVLKTAQPNLILATFEGSFFIFLWAKNLSNYFLKNQCPH